MSDPLEDARNYLRQALGALMEVSDAQKREEAGKAPILLAVRDGVFHDEQIRIWSEEIAAGLSPYLNIETYEDGLDIHAQIQAVISGSIRERVCEAIVETKA